MKSNSVWLSIILILIIAIGVLSWLLFMGDPIAQTQTPEPVATTTVSTSTAPATSTQPLSARVEVTAPLPHATVGKQFSVTGMAPGGWYFEASFPIMVKDVEGSTIGRGVAQAQSDWQTTAQVPFSATIIIDTTYTGTSTLVLLKDNPSGLPENDDSVSIPIMVK